MGIFVDLNVSRSVTKEEWDAVYQESLRLVEKLPFAEWGEKQIHGIKIPCLIRTKERTFDFGWLHKEEKTGWMADGDYETLSRAEDHFFPKELDGDVEPDSGDALLGLIPACTGYDYKDDICAHTHSLFGNKTQGEPYHIYLLAVACMVESRLKEKAFVSGDITRGQLKNACRTANAILGNPVELPARCDMGRFYERVSVLPLKESEKLSVFLHFYLGNHDAELGTFIRQKFSVASCAGYWKDRMNQTPVGTYGFSTSFKEYMTLGFDLADLCGIVDFSHALKEEPVEERYRKFICEVMKSKVYEKEKNTRDILEISQDEEAPFSIYTYMAQFAFMGARNHKVDRYIPLEEVRSALRERLGPRCDTDKIIDDFLKEDAAKDPVSEDNPELLEKYIDGRCEHMKQQEEQYDISDSCYIPYYKAGNTFEPNLKEQCIKYFKFMTGILSEKDYAALLEKSPQDRFLFLVKQNRSLFIRDIDWERIFSDIKEHKESFGRYYPAVRVSITSESVRDLVRSIIVNDDLYAFLCAETRTGHGEG